MGAAAAAARAETAPAAGEIFNADDRVDRSSVKMGQSVIHGSGLFAARCATQNAPLARARVPTAAPLRVLTAASLRAWCSRLPAGRSLGRVKGTLWPEIYPSQAAAAEAAAGRRYAFLAKR